MNTTLHLFRHDVRRLRWWLLAWVGYWVVMLSLSGDANAGGTDLASFFTGWHRPALRAVMVANTAHVALMAMLLGLLLVPHGPDDPRLFWRTRPLASGDMLRAKGLFIGLFLVAWPVAAELAFWLGWMPLRQAAAQLPAALAEQLAWSAGMAMLLVLGGRDVRRYQFAVLGMLATGLFAIHAAEQISLHQLLIARGESALAALQAESLLPQIWEFLCKPGAVTGSWPVWLGWIGVVTLGVGGWLVIACRYLTPDWRAMRLVVEGLMLVALVAGHVGLKSFPPIDRQQLLNQELNESLHRLPLNEEAKQLEAHLLRATNLGTNGLWGAIERHDFGAGTTNVVFARLEWETAARPNLLPLVQTFHLRVGPLTHRVSTIQPSSLTDRLAQAMAVAAATNRLAICLPELQGFRIATVPAPHLYRMGLDPSAVAEFGQADKPVIAHNAIYLVRVESMAVMPLRAPTSGRAGQMRIQTRWEQPREFPTRQLCLTTRAPAPDESETWSHIERAVPELLVVRNSRTKEAFTMEWTDAQRMQNPNTYVAPLLSPGRRVRCQVWVQDPYISLTARAAHHGFNAEWLAESELLCVRLTLTGRAVREVRLENFRLKPAEER